MKFFSFGQERAEQHSFVNIFIREIYTKYLCKQVPPSLERTPDYYSSHQVGRRVLIARVRITMAPHTVPFSITSLRWLLLRYFSPVSSAQVVMHSTSNSQNVPASALFATANPEKTVKTDTSTEHSSTFPVAGFIWSD